MGAYGPTIRIDVHSLSRLQEIQRLFLLLAQGASKEIDLMQVELSQASGLDSLVLRSIPDTQRDERKLIRVEVEPRHINFLWSGNVDDWLRCSGLVDGLLVDNQPGHQYLTSEEVDDALVELSYME
jgi:hypothetical protein